MTATTLDPMYWPLMELPTVKLPYCAVCGRNRPLNEHHIVFRSQGELIGADGKPRPKPLLTLCGNGSWLGSSGSAEYCHGKAHHLMLHFRNNGGVLEFAEFDKPTGYLDALEHGEWEPIGTEVSEWVC